MSTPPPGYEDGWGMAAIIVLLAVIALAYRLHDASRRIRASRPKPPPRRRFLSWNDRENIQYHHNPDRNQDQ